jgi:hypothetical protein
MSTATVQAQEEDDSARPICMDKIPVPAQDTILVHVGTGRLMSVWEETGKSGQPVYVGRISRPHGSRVTVRVDSEGNLVDLHLER